MASYLYCVLQPARPEAVPPALQGIGATTVRVLSSPALDPLEAWVGSVSDHELRAAGEARAAQALLHNEVVNAALATGRTPLPARFGVYFADDAACANALVAHREELLQALNRVAGTVECSVLIVPREASPQKPRRPSRSEAGAGRRYLEALREHADAKERRRTLVSAEADRVSEAVGQLVRAEGRSTDSRGILSLVHLVPRNALAEYIAVISLAKADAPARMILGAVRAPYSFAVWNWTDTGHDSSSPSDDDRARR